MKQKTAYWIGGTLIALLGVTVVRLLAPALAGLAGSLAVVAGYLLVVVGIMVLARATRRREALLTIENEAKD